MKKKKKVLIPRSELRARLARRSAGRKSLFNGEREGTWRLEKLPAQLLRTTNEHFFEKTIAAILAVIFLGLFSLVDYPLANRLTEAVHRLTIHQVSPGELVEQIQPVMQSVRDFSWRRHELPPRQEPPVAGDEEMGAPVNGVLISPYGPRQSAGGEGNEMHYGIDVSAGAGDPVYAVLAGVVSLVQDHPLYGLTVYIKHGDDLVTIYGRCQRPLVAAGDRVKKGQQIAEVAAGPQGSHLHFEVWQAGKPVDPQEYISVGR